MGKTRPLFIKNAAKDMIKKYPDLLTTDFEKSKEFLNRAAIIHSKRVRNRIAGYIVHLMKKRQNNVHML